MNTFSRIISILILLTLFLGCAPSVDADYDVLIKGGKIYDGTMDPPYTGDIGIKGDRIVAIGVVTGKAREVIDATGLIVTPGFIDCHNHTVRSDVNCGHQTVHTANCPA